MKRIIATVLCALLAFAGMPANALQMSDIEMLTEEQLREAIRGDEVWVNNYPNGLINFIGGQYELSESDRFLEIAIARQGGVSGEVSVDFKAIDVSAEYGKDYVIRVYDNSPKSQLEKNEDSVLLTDSLAADPEINISKIVEETGDKTEENESGTYASEEPEKMLAYQLRTSDSPHPYFQSTKTPDSLREIKESTTGRESDRPYWRDLDRQRIEQMKAKYDDFFLSIPGTETKITFACGEYIKYLYVIPLNDKLSESEEQMVFALTNPTGGAVRGEFYMASTNLTDDEEFEESIFSLAEGSVIAGQDSVSVTVLREGGLSQYASVYIGTEQGTAVADLDYRAGLQELLFTPGMEEQTVTVDVLDNPKRISSREFVIALDLDSNIDPGKGRTAVLVRPSAAKMQLQSREVIRDTTGVEKITSYGRTPAKGQWIVSANDLNRGSKKGSTSISGSSFRINITGGSGWTKLSDISLYGVSSVFYDFKNTGNGRDWTTTNWYPFWSKVPHNEKKYSTTLSVSGSNSSEARTRYHYGYTDGISGTMELLKSNWSSSSITVSTKANDENQSFVSVSSIRLNLKEYDLKIRNNETNVPQFISTEYNILNGALISAKSAEIGQPGKLYIKNVYSNVKNRMLNNPAGTESVSVYRSDLIEFGVTINDNEAGKIQIYDGFEVYNGSNWVKYSGTTLSLDTDFFAANKMSNYLYSKSDLLVRPVFKPQEAKLTVEVDADRGYIDMLGEDTARKEFSVQLGDSINIKAKANVISRKPVWTAAKKDNLTMLDSTGVDNSARYKVGLRNDRLSIVFDEPALEVRAEPMEYRHRAGRPVYYIDGERYDHNSLTALHRKMDGIFARNADGDPANDLDPLIRIEFSYVFDSPDISEKIRFGDPDNAVLRVYRSDGILHGEYPLPRTAGSPWGYSASASNGNYTFSGHLKDLGWQDGYYASVVIYGTKTYGSGMRMSTNENSMDFLNTTGNAITLQDTDDTLIAGDIYTPIVIDRASAMHQYLLRSYPNPGFITKWMDTSGDFDGDGQESDDDGKLAGRMEELGFDLQTLRANNAIYGMTFTGNFFSYAPLFFDPSRVYYHYVKQAAAGSTNYTTRVIVNEKYTTVLNPAASSKEIPVAGATVIVGDRSYLTDETGAAYITDQYFPEKGSYYTAEIVHKGYSYYTYVRAGFDTPHDIDTSDTMRPYNFSAKFYPAVDADDPDPAPESIKLDSRNTFVPVRNGNTEFSFMVNSGKAGVVPNDAVIRIYTLNEAGGRSEMAYESRTGSPQNGSFTHSVDLLDNSIRPGQIMTISPLYMEGGEVVREYPEVDVGLVFSQDLDILSIPASFDTPLQPTVKFLGKLNNKFDLGMDIALDDIMAGGTRVDSETGLEYNTKSITFGYKKEYEKKFGDQKDEEEETSPTPAPTSDADTTPSPEPTDPPNAVEDEPEDAIDKDSAKKLSSSSGGSFKFEFEVALTLTIEEGQKINEDGLVQGDGYHYFSSMVLMAQADSSYEYKYTYITPIGVPVFASINISGQASATLAIEANDGERHVAKYRFDSEGNISLDPKEYSIYTRFTVCPSVVIGAGVGMDFINASISGTAEGNFEFTIPVTGENEKSSGSGGLVFSASVGINVLFIQKKWTIYESEPIDLFGYGTEAQSVMSILSDPYTNHMYSRIGKIEEGDILSREYLSDRTAVSSLDVKAGSEIVLRENAYPYPQTKLTELGDGKLLALFIGDAGRENRDDINRAQLFYSVYDGSTWSDPAAVDTDDTWDESPDAFIVEDKILVTWSDAHRQFTAEDNAKTILQAMNISARWFDVESASFTGDEIALTREISVDPADAEEAENYFVDQDYADVDPMVSFDRTTGRLMVFYTKIDYDDYWYGGVTEEDILNYDQADLYGDLANAYSIIAYRFAEKDAEGNFVWNDHYDRPIDEEKGYTEENYFHEKYFYGQRFLDLAVDIDIEETEEYYVQDGVEGVRTIQQIPDVLQPLVADPLVTDSSMITYNGLALHGYSMDADGDRKTTNDQEIYLQIYNYELDGFIHPIRLTINDKQDSKPEFIRTGNITYLYWISGGDIVYMDITNLVRNDLKKVTVNVKSGSQMIPRDYYIIDKTNTSKDAHIDTAVSSREDYPVDDFSIKSDNESQYLLFTDHSVSYKNGLQPGDPGTEDPENMIREKQIFAAYSRPSARIEYKNETDAYTETDDFGFVYAQGKGPGTYPEFMILKKVISDQEEVDFLNDLTGQDRSEYPAGEMIELDYGTVPDINGFTGVVCAGDDVISQTYMSGGEDGLAWSVPVQMTHEEGANYSDIDFVLNSDPDIQAVYIKYEQLLGEDNLFEDDTNGRILAFDTLSVESSLSETGIDFGEDIARSGSNFDFSLGIRNDGLKPLTGLEYMSYLVQDGEVIMESDRNQVVTDLATGSLMLGGHRAVLNAGFILPERIEGLKAGFKILSSDGTLLLSSERSINAEAVLDITVTDSSLIDAETARIDLYISNEGNIPYKGDIEIMLSNGNKRLAVQKIDLQPAAKAGIAFRIDISGDMFGDLVRAADGSVYDALPLTIKAGDHSIQTDIRRSASKEIAQDYANVRSFTIEGTEVTLGSGSTMTLNTVKKLNVPIPEIEGDPLKVRWISSDTDVAVVLQDGTVLGLGEGRAEVTAILEPDRTKLATNWMNILETVDERYKMPAGLFIEDAILINVANEEKPESEPDPEPVTSEPEPPEEDPEDEEEPESKSGSKEDDIEISPEKGIKWYFVLLAFMAAAGTAVLIYLKRRT